MQSMSGVNVALQRNNMFETTMMNHAEDEEICMLSLDPDWDPDICIYRYFTYTCMCAPLACVHHAAKAWKVHV